MSVRSTRSCPVRAAKPIGAAASLLILGLALVGCGSVSGALSEGQQALDQGRAVVESATGAVGAADALIAAGSELAAACTAAQAAWVPGVSAADARAAIDEALRMVDGVVAQTPDVPGATELADALASARTSLESGDGALGMSPESLETACALVTLGG